MPSSGLNVKTSPAQSPFRGAAPEAGSQTGSQEKSYAPRMTDSTARRRGHGEDAIYFDAAKNRFVGAISVGFGPGGKRIRRKVTGPDQGRGPGQAQSGT